MSAVRPIVRKPSLTPSELHKERDDFLSQVDVLVDGVKEIPLFANDVPHVRTDKVVKATGMPPAEWALV